MSDAALSSGWQAISALQQHLEKNKWLDAASLADEEAVADVLDAFLSGDPVEGGEINRSFHSRRLNRRRRNRHREKLVRRHAEESVRPRMSERVCDASVDIQNRDFLVVVEQKLDAASYSLLKRIAAGSAYVDIAVELEVSAAALRERALRARRQAKILAA